jgi:hypothetical protein
MDTVELSKDLLNESFVGEVQNKQFASIAKQEAQASNSGDDNEGQYLPITPARARRR